MEKTISIKIGNREIGPGHPTYIIFEVASTHENDWEIARAYVDQAKEAGADALKFQLFRADTLLNPITSGLKGTYEYFKTAETPWDWFPKLKELCDQRGIDLLCTPFDLQAASFLNGTGIPTVKIASGDLTNHQLLAHVALFHKPIILSTGMATMEEIKQAVQVIRDMGNEELALLQCVSVYPTSFQDANVSAMNHLKKAFDTLVGYSDNGSPGFLVPLMAVAFGASIIEKHVTSQKRRGNLDDIFSLSVEEFADMVRKIRMIEQERDKEKVLSQLKAEYGEDFEKAMGDGIKRPASHGTLITHPGVPKPFLQKEADERHWARRGVYPARDIRKGTLITPDMLVVLRPDVGISGLQYQEVLGKTAAEDLPARHPLKIHEDQVFQFHLSDAESVYPDPQDVDFVKTLKQLALFR
ncbi:MAG: N-acetylneuraminate synthase family protein [Patescibacteria group bacterium]